MGRRRVTVTEAADLLGLTVEAIRGRIKRGTIDHERDGERVFVIVDAAQPSTSRSRSTDKPDDRPRAPHPDEDEPARELVEELRDRVAFLERELERRSVEATRYQEIVAGLAQANARLSARVPELEASPTQEPRESRESAAEGEPGTNTPTTNASPQTGVQTRPRSWWRRLIGG